MWKYFLDHAYYGQWAVRHTENRGFHEAIHVRTEEEARFLVDSLNELDRLQLIEQAGPLLPSDDWEDIE
jgi:hypothetical protein